MTIERVPCVYILASGFNGRLYVGVTSNLIGRILQHRAGTFDGHTKKYGIKRLVHFETADTMEAVFAREKQLKRYRAIGSAPSSSMKIRRGMISLSDSAFRP
ncbi:hypothetical protein GCM10011395_10330 [Sphingomonas psychrolutea]|uniref:GIY-YIG domain-containing protein n=1 Tax=Sphingomonas psychrolutea TaxID=1259676 RepID=A0ABQ1GE80_9SPHN|nr:hypothetical protein GCM10011395_10330 [Sphingomonas psychrolutea]